jgi:hypothetical protein
MRSLLRRGPKPGTVFDGLVTYCHDYSLVEKPGYYALGEDGKQLQKPLLRLTWVDDAPGDEDDGSGHYEVSAKTDPISRAGAPVPLEAESHGSAEVSS